MGSFPETHNDLKLFLMKQISGKIETIYVFNVYFPHQRFCYLYNFFDFSVTHDIMQNHNIGVGEDHFNRTAFDGTKRVTCLVKTLQPRVALRSLERVSNA